MAVSEAVQAARKAKQLERIEKKKGLKTAKDAAGYAEWYANQPMQLVRAQKNAVLQANRRKLDETNEVLAVAEIDGVGLEEAKHAQAVAALVVERSQPGPRTPHAAGLSGA